MTLTFLHDEDYACNRIRQAQSQRVSRLIICKAFLPIAEEYAYSEVYLFCESKLWRFRAAATSRRANTPDLRGNLTKTLCVSDIDFLDMNASLAALKDVCPNVRHMNIVYYGRASYVAWGTFLAHWSASLESLSWSDSTMTVDEILASFPPWENLKLLSLPTRSLVYGAYSFSLPTVTHLSIQARALAVGLEVLCPNLEAVRLTMSHEEEIDGVFGFIHRHQDHLKCVELNATRRVSLGSLSQSLFNSPKLDTLILGEKFSRLDPGIIGNTGIKTLFYRLGHTFKRPDIKHFMKGIAPKLDVSLERFVLVVDPGHEAAGQKKISQFGPILRHGVTLELKMDPIYGLWHSFGA